MGSFSIFHWLVVLLVITPVLYAAIAGVTMWCHYMIFGKRKHKEAIGAGDRLPTQITVTDESEFAIWSALPKLAPGQRLAMEFIRDPYQNIYLGFVLLPTIILILTVVGLVIYDIEMAAIVISVLLLLTLIFWVSWKLLYAFVLGHTIRVSPLQYPQLFRLIEEASQILGIECPYTFIMQGHGLFETLVMKRFSRRGFIILTSNLVDDLTERGASRELMFFVGRQLGLMATGYFRFWFTKGILGKLALPFYLAWERRCHYTADRIGLLVAGDLLASEQALVTLTAGSAVAPSTSAVALVEQRLELLESVWSWIRLSYSSYPYMVDRIIRLRAFALAAIHNGIQAKQPVGALPLGHGPIRSLPVMIVHGHDAKSRLELENFLFKTFPNVAPIAMLLETAAAATMPEKFEEIASRVRGAVALLTPDDVIGTTRDGGVSFRARQNVVIEIGWYWGRLGRNKCLLLMKDTVDIPSDLSGVEVHRYRESPIECSEALRDFVAALEQH